MKIKRIFNFIKNKICSYEERAEMLRKMGVIIGKNSEIYSTVNFGSEPYLIKIGDNVRISSCVKFITHDGGMWVLRNNGKLKNADKFGKIKIGNNVHIGINVIIMPGVTIGDNCVIGCGAIVTKDIPSNSVAVGIPAKVIETIDEYYIKNKDKCVYTKDVDSNKKEEYLRKLYVKSEEKQ